MTNDKQCAMNLEVNSVVIEMATEIVNAAGASDDLDQDLVVEALEGDANPLKNIVSL